MFSPKGRRRRRERAIAKDTWTSKRSWGIVQNFDVHKCDNLNEMD